MYGSGDTLKQAERRKDASICTSWFMSKPPLRPPHAMALRNVADVRPMARDHPHRGTLLACLETGETFSSLIRWGASECRHLTRGSKSSEVRADNTAYNYERCIHEVNDGFPMGLGTAMAKQDLGMCRSQRDRLPPR